MTTPPVEEYRAVAPYLMSYQAFWEGQIRNNELTLWQRIFAVAMARSEPNLHSPFQPGELARILGRTQLDGSLKPVGRVKVWEAIGHLIKIGWLDVSSDRLCLVLPVNGFACYRPGYKKQCAYHVGESSKVKKEIAVRVRQQEAPIEESYRSVENVQARAILRSENRNGQFRDGERVRGERVSV